MNKQVKDHTAEGFLYFPLERMARNESIFKDAAAGEFTDKYRPILKPIIGKQLAVNTYYRNDLIAAANTRISIDLLRVFDELKINFKVNRTDVTDDAREYAFYAAMNQIMKGKREFLDSVASADIPALQTSVRDFLTRTLKRNNVSRFQAYYEEMKGYVEFAGSVIASEDRYILTAAALKRVLENEKRVFGLVHDDVGETMEHIVKTTWISLMLARELDDFTEKDCDPLSIICMGHDNGKALIPESILYKKGRLTQLENDIVKSHVLLSYLLSSNDQQNLNFESFAMALHHVKENKKLPQSYGISADTHISFYEYLTPEAQVRLNEIYHLTKRYYRVIGIADTFEAISAPRVYKKASSIGDALAIMINCNRKDGLFYQPYLDAFISFMIRESLPKNLKFKINDDILDYLSWAETLTPEQKERFKQQYLGVIINSCSTFDSTLDCVIFDPGTQQVHLKIQIPPMHFLKTMYFD